MKAKHRQSGLTLTEMAVVVGVVALLAGIALPTIRMVVEAFESGDSAMSMISSALTTARALAAKEGHYVGVRFQKAYNRNAADPLNPLTASQYMVFIIHDSSMMASGYRVLDGTEPIKLPDSIGVMDMTVVARTYSSGQYTPNSITDKLINDDQLIDDTSELADSTTFSIVFSPSGKLVIRKVQVRNSDDYPDTTTNGSVSNDNIFNKKAQVDGGLGMFYQDDYCGAWFSAYPDLGLGPEDSRNSFVIYNRTQLKSAFKANAAWSSYLANLVGDMTYINPHTGMIIRRN